MTTTEIATLAALLERFRDTEAWDRRERPADAYPDEAAISRTLGVVRRTANGTPLYRRGTGKEPGNNSGSIRVAPLGYMP